MTNFYHAQPQNGFFDFTTRISLKEYISEPGMASDCEESLFQILDGIENHKEIMIPSRILHIAVNVLDIDRLSEDEILAIARVFIMQLAYRGFADYLIEGDIKLVEYAVDLFREDLSDTEVGEDTSNLFNMYRTEIENVSEDPQLTIFDAMASRVQQELIMQQLEKECDHILSWVRGYMGDHDVYEDVIVTLEDNGGGAPVEWPILQAKLEFAKSIGLYKMIHKVTREDIEKIFSGLQSTD